MNKEFKMRCWAPLNLFCFLFLICSAPFGCSNSPDIEREQAIAMLKTMKGELVYENDHFDQPVISVSLSGDEVNDAGLACLERLSNKLRVLRIRHCGNVTNAGLHHLRSGMNRSGMNNLEELTLSFTQVNDDGLAHLKGLKKLHTLDLTYSEITDDGLEYLSEIKNLKHLTLRGTSVSDTGLTQLAKLANLTELDLSHTQVTGSGLVHLAKLQNLKTLKLGHTQITDHGLLQLKGPASLEHLSLWKTPVTDAGLDHLKELPNLKSIFVVGSAVTSAGLDKLQRERPNLKITW